MASLGLNELKQTCCYAINMMIRSTFLFSIGMSIVIKDYLSSSFNTMEIPTLKKIYLYTGRATDPFICLFFFFLHCFFLTLVDSNSSWYTRGGSSCSSKSGNIRNILSVTKRNSSALSGTSRNMAARWMTVDGSHLGNNNHNNLEKKTKKKTICIFKFIDKHNYEKILNFLGNKICWKLYASKYLILTDGLLQGSGNSMANAMGLPQYSTEWMILRLWCMATEKAISHLEYIKGALL